MKHSAAQKAHQIGVEFAVKKQTLLPRSKTKLKPGYVLHSAIALLRTTDFCFNLLAGKREDFSSLDDTRNALKRVMRSNACGNSTKLKSRPRVRRILLATFGTRRFRASCNQQSCRRAPVRSM
eukprot:6180719-Pleurochrysis_carterae.AAC.1